MWTNPKETADFFTFSKEIPSEIFLLFRSNCPPTSQKTKFFFQDFFSKCDHGKSKISQKTLFIPLKFYIKNRKLINGQVN